MSQYKSLGVNPKTGREVGILSGYDSVPGFRAGYFFQVYLLPEDKDYKKDSENCILNLGMLNGLSKKEFDTVCENWKVSKTKPVNKSAWI